METEERERTVEIARDVLAHIADYSVRDGQGYIVGPELKNDDSQVQAQVDTVMKECKVCALGACLLAKARLYNDLTFEKLRELRKDGQAGMLNGLLGYIDRRTALLIEAAFECTVSWAYSSADWHSFSTHARGAAAFGMKFEDPVERLKAIMTNIVDNAGVMVVEPLGDEAYDSFLREYSGRLWVE